MMSRTIEVTRAELGGRRTSILARLGLTSDEFGERVRAGSLSPTEWEALSELEEMAFLLGDPTDGS